MEISCRVYKPRRPRESPLYGLVERHLAPERTEVGETPWQILEEEPGP